MPIYKNEKNNSYYIRVYVKDKEGKTKQIRKNNKNWIGREGKLLAQQEEIRILNSKNNIPYEDLNITLEELCQEYLKHIETMVRESSYQEYKSSIIKYILPYFKKRNVQKIKNTEIVEWHKILENYKFGNGKNLSYLTKQKLHCTFSAVLKYGCMYKNLKQNVVKNVGGFKKNKLEKDIQEEMTIITQKDFQKFIDKEKNFQYKLFFYILFYTGMRKGELLALNWEDIDFTKKTIKISKSLRMRKDAKLERPKTTSSFREIKMINCVYDMLSSAKQEQGRIFSEGTITGETLRRKCKKNFKAIDENKNFRVHDLRHSFASMCIENQIPVEVISQYMGHKNITTTLNVYSHLYPNAQNKLVDKLNLL